MKADIHPEFYLDTVVTCNCGNKFITGSTEKEIKVEVCSKCHPFYKGQTGNVASTGGQIDKFNKRAAQATNNNKSSSN